MSTVSVQQAGGAFQPVNIAVTLTTEEELFGFSEVLQAGLLSTDKLRLQNINTQASRNLANQLSNLVD